MNGLCPDCGHPRDDHQWAMVGTKCVTGNGPMIWSPWTEHFICFHRVDEGHCLCGMPPQKSLEEIAKEHGWTWPLADPQYDEEEDEY